MAGRALLGGYFVLFSFSRFARAVMTSYRLSPFIDFIESRLIPDVVQYGIAHRLTGQIFEPTAAVNGLLRAIKLGTPFSFNEADIGRFGTEGRQIEILISTHFLVPEGEEPLLPFLDLRVVRPLQNPAIVWRDAGAYSLVRLPMSERVYSPGLADLPSIIEEQMPSVATSVIMAADGTRTLREIHATLRTHESLLDDEEFRSALDFLTSLERQLIKLAHNPDDLMDPFAPPNIVPRNFYHASRWPTGKNAKSIAEFHLEGVEDADWEFDLIEPTVNHALRFRSSLLGGLDYGSRFWEATVAAGVISAAEDGATLKVLEVGGGTGSFARSLIERAGADRPIQYQIMDLSPALASSQRRMLKDVDPPVVLLGQDATEFDLPGQEFDLIISNEVIADFPVAMVERRVNADGLIALGGEGAGYVSKYRLSTGSAPESFYVNAGVFQFVERAWKHLAPGGTLIMTEYGSESSYPVESFHLNHPEFSIHFGHLTECAQGIGYECRLLSLMEFLSIKAEAPVLNGREEQLRCLNHVFEKAGISLPFALFSQADFKEKFGELTKKLQISPIRFLPLSANFHYGPHLAEFLVLILRKPPEIKGIFG